MGKTGPLWVLACCALWRLLPVAGAVTTVPLLFYAAGIRTTLLTLSGI